MDPGPSTCRDDYPNPWRIEVRGYPPRREAIRWREAIREAVTVAYPDAPFTSSPSGTKFDVQVIFRMTQEDLARPAVDLDNFAKPVLDTLFTSQNVSRTHRRASPGGERHVGVPAPSLRRSKWRLRRSRVLHHGHLAPTGYPGSQRCFGFSPLRAEVPLRTKSDYSGPGLATTPDENRPEQIMRR